MPRREIDGGLIGKDAHDVGTALDLPVQTLERISRVDLGPVFPGERHVRENIRAIAYAYVVDSTKK